jgi:hypothetical protein
VTFLTERLKFGGCHRINQVVHSRDQPAVRPLIEDEPLIERMLYVPLNPDSAPLEITFIDLPVRPQFRVFEFAAARLQTSSDQSLLPPFAARSRTGGRAWSEFLTNHRGNRQR